MWHFHTQFPHKLLIFILWFLGKLMSTLILYRFGGPEYYWPVPYVPFYKWLHSLDVWIIKLLLIYMYTESLCVSAMTIVSRDVQVYALFLLIAIKNWSRHKLRKPCCLCLQKFSVFLQVNSSCLNSPLLKKRAIWAMFSLCSNVESTTWLLTGTTKSKPRLSLCSRLGGLLSRPLETCGTLCH